MKKALIIVGILLALIIFVNIFFYYYKKQVITNIVYNLSNDIRTGNIDTIDKYFDKKFSIDYKNNNYSIDKIKTNLKISKDIFRDMYVSNFSKIKDNNINIIAWTKDGELDFTLSIAKNGLFGYKIASITCMDIDNDNELIFHKFFINYNANSTKK